ncbi:MAG TPA: hypothetical protein VFT64_04145 [Rickettsiales bacterium]|nr:hypothetical protein [Rickettsiales bacterium]
MDGITDTTSVTAQLYKAPAAPAPQTQSAAPVIGQHVKSAPVSPVQTDALTKYAEAVHELSLSYKDFYALGDQTFSIFKDATGQFITRYVSLRDGSVTYVPAPVLVKHLSPPGGMQLTINA